MIKYFHNTKNLAILLFVGASILTSCQDKDMESELKLDNSSNKTAVSTDTSMNINTYTYQQADSIYLNPESLLLGYNVDDKFGEFQNNFMTEVTIASFDVSFGANPVVDSLILYLDYTYCYGDMSQTQTITVYELNKNLPLNDTDNSIHGKPMDESVISKYYDNSNPVTTFSFTPNPNDTVPIRVALPPNFYSRFLDSANYASLDSFQTNIFRGFYFVAEPISSGGAISYFNVSDSTNMQLFYHNDKDTLIYKYVIDAYTYRCNIFKRKINPQINVLPIDAEADTNLIQESFYIKFNNALEGRVEITDLQNWADSGFFTLNKANLSVYVEQPQTATDSIYYYIPPLSVYQLNEDKKLTYLADYITDNKYLEVNFDTLPNGHGYNINLKQTLYYAIQNDYDKLTLILKPNKETNRSHANRIILNGLKSTKQPILRLTYTKLNID
jgi:hypothetical protein